MTNSAPKLIWWKPDLAQAFSRSTRQLDNWVLAKKFPPPDVAIGSRKGWSDGLVQSALRTKSAPPDEAA